ncbi:APC family permease [uncultured Fretibacterium sp.]|uniref:APC family permease n=1 Tax=uncultured Fretibacterium sp. TaxID=1678694 RepID=UPI00325F9856
MNDSKLKRNLSFVQMIAISSGAVIGGWLAEAPYWFQTTGAGAAFLFPLLALLLVPVGLAFGELSAMLPFAAGVDAWTSNAYGNKMGFATQWMMFLIQVVEPPMMAFIFGTAINHFYPLNSDQMMMVAIFSVTLWFVLSNFNISLTGKLSNFFFFSMIVISLLVSSSFFLSGHWSMDHIRLNQGFFPKGGYGIFIAMAVFSLKFIGFEMTPTLIEETNFPASKIWKVILASLFIPALLYSFVVLAMGGMAPWHEIASMSMPEPELVARFGLPAILGILAIVSGLMHAFTTLMGFWTSSARVLYGAAQLNQLPRGFIKVNRYGQPFLANVVVYMFSLFFCFFSGDNWVQYIYAISSIAAGVVYFISCLDVVRLRRLHPEWKRPFRAPGGLPMFLVGMGISIWLVIGACMELDAGGYLSLLLFFGLGVVVFWVADSYRRKQGRELTALTPEDIGRE